MTLENQKKSFDVVNNIIAYEEGQLDDTGVIDLFQHLVNSGLAWQLQGSYGRMAQRLINDGLVARGNENFLSRNS